MSCLLCAHLCGVGVEGVWCSGRNLYVDGYACICLACRHVLRSLMRVCRIIIHPRRSVKTSTTRGEFPSFPHQTLFPNKAGEVGEGILTPVLYAAQMESFISRKGFCCVRIKCYGIFGDDRHTPKYYSIPCTWHNATGPAKTKYKYKNCSKTVVGICRRLHLFQ